MECSVCEKKLKEGEVFYGDVGTYHEGKPLCECCYCQSEPAAVVYYGKDENPYATSETRNETYGDSSEKAKADVNYDNPKWYRNMIFDENASNKIAELFPERKMKN